MVLRERKRYEGQGQAKAWQKQSFSIFNLSLFANKSVYLCISGRRKNPLIAGVERKKAWWRLGGSDPFFDFPMFVLAGVEVEKEICGAGAG